MPAKLLKLLKSTLSFPLTFFNSYSFSTGAVPEKLKIERVLPVYKKGPREVISNCRPLSLLSIFNKIIEKLMYGRVIN